MRPSQPQYTAKAPVSIGKWPGWSESKIPTAVYFRFRDLQNTTERKLLLLGSLIWILTLKAPTTTATDDKFCDIFPCLLPADDSHEIWLICYFWKSSKIYNCRLLQIIGDALWVNLGYMKFCVYLVSAQDRYMGGMSGQTPSGRPVVRKKVVHTGTSGGGGYQGSSSGTVVRKRVVHTDTSGGGGYQGSSDGTVVRKTVVRTGSSGGDYHDSAGGPVMRKSIVHTESVPVVKKTVHQSVTRTETVVTGIGNIWIEFIYRNWCIF